MTNMVYIRLLEAELANILCEITNGIGIQGNPYCNSAVSKAMKLLQTRHWNGISHFDVDIKSIRVQSPSGVSVDTTGEIE
jgi:hypothetical protein